MNKGLTIASEYSNTKEPCVASDNATLGVFECGYYYASARQSPASRRVSQSPSFGLFGLKLLDTLNRSVYMKFLVPDSRDALLGNNFIGPLPEIGSLSLQSSKEGF
jgi:hypothetical protein